jgi:O-antigen/teichoic acid export membrane protein
MGIIIRQSIKASFAGYIGTVVGAFNILWLSPKFLTKSQIGLINWIESIGLLLLVLSCWGATNLSDRFFPTFQNHEKKHNGFLIFLFLYGYVAFLCLGTIFYFTHDFWLGLYENNAPENKAYIFYVFLYAGLLLQLMLLEGYARGHLRIAIPAFFRDVILRILIIISVVLFAYKYYSFDILVLLRVFLYGFVGILMWLYLKKLDILYLKLDFEFITGKRWKEIFIYGTYIFLAGAGSLVVMKIDVVMIPAMLNNEALGIYTIAYFLGSVIEIPRKAIAQISTPIISQAWKENNLENIKNVYQKSALNQSIIGCFLFLGIWLNIDSIFLIMPNGQGFAEGKWVVFFIALTRLLDMATGVSTEILLQSKYFRFNFWLIILLALIMIVGNYFLIPIYQIDGAALATFLSFFLYNFIKFIFIWVKFNLQPFNFNILKVFILSGFIALSISFLPLWNNVWLNIIQNSIYITLIFSLGVFVGKLSPDITNLIKLSLKK